MPSVAHLVRPDIAALEPYSPAAPLEVLASRLGLPVERIVKLDANENPYGPSPRALEALASYRYYAIYPDPDQTLLRAALSRHVDHPPERIICGSCSDEVIDMLVRAFLRPGRAPTQAGVACRDEAGSAGRPRPAPARRSGRRT